MMMMAAWPALLVQSPMQHRQADSPLVIGREIQAVFTSARPLLPGR
jgi:hypothetical protein